MSDRRDDPRPITIWTPGEGKPVPRYKRSPRRAYDAEGREIAPATIANARQNGARGILTSCKCGHQTLLSFDGLADAAFVPDVALRLRCSACGGGAKGIETTPDFTERGMS